MVKQWPSGLVSARAVVGTGESGADPVRQPATSMNLQIWANPGHLPRVQLGPPSLGSRPSLSGSVEQAGSLGACVRRAGRREKTLVCSSAPSLGMAWGGPSVGPPTL